MEKNKRVFGLGTEVYKGVCELDGNAYVLRRVESGWKAYSWRIKTFEG